LHLVCPRTGEASLPDTPLVPEDDGLSQYRRRAAFPNLSVEQKRALTKGIKGVHYDDRIDRFTAAITVEGHRRWLGSFLTVAGAAAAFEDVRRENPIRRPGTSRFDPDLETIPKLYREFRNNCELDEYGHPAKGQVFTAPDGQVFTVIGKVTFQPKKNGRNRKYVFLKWASRCRVCGCEYDLKTNARVRAISSITRTCKEHRGKGGQFRSPPVGDKFDGMTDVELDAYINTPEDGSDLI